MDKLKLVCDIINLMMSNIKRILFGIVALFLILGVVWLFRTEIKDLINRVPDTPVIVFPAVESSSILKKDFDTNSLSLEMSRFISGEAKEKELLKLKYANTDSGKVLGFEISYKLDSSNRNLNSFYEDQLYRAKNNGWKLLSANLGDSQMFLDIGYKNPSADYKVRISAEQQEDFLGIKMQYLITRD